MLSIVHLNFPNCGQDPVKELKKHLRPLASSNNQPVEHCSTISL